MGFKVLKSFIDKDNLKGFSTGNVYESNDSKRIAFLQKEGYLEIKDIPGEKAVEETEVVSKPKSKRPRKKKAGE
jgi:hypothetical protein